MPLEAEVLGENPRTGRVNRKNMQTTHREAPGSGIQATVFLPRRRRQPPLQNIHHAGPIEMIAEAATVVIAGKFPPSKKVCGDK